MTQDMRSYSELSGCQEYTGGGHWTLGSPAGRCSRLECRVGGARCTSLAILTDI